MRSIIHLWEQRHHKEYLSDVLKVNFPYLLEYDELSEL